MSSLHEKFVNLGKPRRIWAVASINGDYERLVTLHDHIATRFNVRDRLVYLGNYIGMGAFDNRAVIEELLAFRSALLAKSGMEAADIVHLRGPAEEAWQRLLRLQFAPAPTQALDRYLEFGAESYLRLYGVSLNDTRSMARAGSVAMTRWTNQLRMLQRETPGHEAFVCSTRRAALAATEDDKAVLFVPAGYNGTKLLEEQGDNLWFSNNAYALPENNKTLSRIVRGYDPMHNGICTDGRAVTLDGGAGRGGPLVCGCFNADGNLLEMIAVGGKGAVESSRFETITRPPMPTRSPLQPTIVPEQPTLWESMQASA